jgi:hypothetical protein
MLSSTSQKFAKFNFTPSSTLKDPMSLSSTMPSQIMLLPSNCWRLRCEGDSFSDKKHPFEHPSGPSKLTLDWSVKVNLLNSVFRLVLAYSKCFSIAFWPRGGLPMTFFTLAILFKALHLFISLYSIKSCLF